jgi:plasmid stabilization system protein ParE
MVPEYQRPELRERIQGRYRLVYRIISDELIEIIAVHHSARQMPDNL